MRTIPMLASLAVSVLLMACPLMSRAASDRFSGDWSVQWCDASDTQAECGGFFITLVQRGERLCGSYDGARVRVSQVDEGNPLAIRGVVTGKTAVLTIESQRSGAIYLVRAVARGDTLHWQVMDTVKPMERDIDIIALDDTLSRGTRGTPSGRGTQIADACLRAVTLQD